jgi:hypothetical protein
MWTGCFKEFPKVVFGRSSSPLEIVFDSCYELLTGVVGFLPAVAFAGRCSEVMWSALLPLLSTLRTLSGTFGGGRSRATEDEGGPDSLFA